MKKIIALILSVALNFGFFIETDGQPSLLNNFWAPDLVQKSHSAKTFATEGKEFDGNNFVKTGRKNKKPKFSSIYTGLIAGCRSSGGENGGHVSTFCKGVGNYRIHVFDSATTLEFLVETPDREDPIQLASQSLNYNTKRNKVEWRMADGVPFAVILRTNTYKTKDDVIDYPVKITGEFLVVKGLQGYETIDFEVNAKTLQANQKARRQAEAAFCQIKKNC
jgi:hypothetical protein